ncbi:MAG: glutaminase A [Myxococcota bacterium]
MFERARPRTEGALPDYIPQLSRVSPDFWATSVCTIDGECLDLGDADVGFCAQSCCKPLNYCMALEETGEANVHAHVGREPSGRGYNDLALNFENKPHNPMINAGAIMTCSLIRPHLPMADRFDAVLAQWEHASSAKVGFDNAVFLSERQTADRNFALGYLMREHRVFPAGTDLLQTLEFYFMCCSIEVTTKSMAALAGTLANGGVNPLSQKRVLEPRTVRNCLSLMSSCGMYDFSGEFAFTVGLPAKSGVAGGILVVIPNVLGMATWSPLLDTYGNSVRGLAMCRDLVSVYNFHNYDSLTGLSGKEDPRTRVRTTEA